MSPKVSYWYFSQVRSSNNSLRQREVGNGVEFVTVVDAMHRVVAVSSAYAMLLGYEPHELSGMRTVDLVADRAEYDRLFAELVETGRIDATVGALSKTGEVVPYRFKERTTVTDVGEQLFVAVGTPAGQSSPIVDLMTVQEVAEFAHVHRRTVERWIRAGELPALGTPGARRIVRADVEALLRRRAH